ncbi:MAG: glycosyltransferase family 2 protein, partial [Ruminococcus flavefaciens]|nr:glycosyltransferase family 2 protein [Ruminococcus flavefaciens]
KEKKLVIIILNYMNYNETDECVQSVLNQNYKNYHILIVDNHSENKSYIYLEKKYHEYHQITVIKTGKNYGFAKGNNIGICYARQKLHADYILLLNSDVIMEDSDYIDKMMALDSYKTGVIGSRIVEPNNFIIDQLYRYVSFPSTLFFYLARKAEYKNHPLYQNFWEYKLSKYEGVYVLKGCVLLLTPAYFKYYKDLDSRTFLYCEEELLYIRCKRAGLEEKFDNSIYVYHKGGQSTSILYGNGRKKFLKYLLASYKFVLWESIKSFCGCISK